VSRRAFLSVYDKSGIVDFARAMVELGWELVSSGGTARTIADAGIAVIDVAELTGYPAILGHRVVTLHPKVHGGILADPTDPDHQADLARHDIVPISLVVANLYPFATKPGIEMIDIGGPTLVRAAAKNHAHVGIVVDPADYALVVDELRDIGWLSGATRRALARKAFSHTATYDAAIVTWLDERDDGDSDGAVADAAVDATLPVSLHLAAELAQPLRYGENPHQRGARYRFAGQRSWWDESVQHGGKELSYLNVYDTEAAWRLVNRFTQPAVVVVKHANPCGVAVADDITAAYQLAHECDPVSAFGGVVAVNRAVPDSLARLLAPVFTEVVVAPSFDADALATLAAKKNLRTLSGPPPAVDGLDLRAVDGGLLVQQRDPVSLDRSDWRVVSQRQPSAVEWDELVFAWAVVAAVSSNAIVITRDRQAIGIGAGQQNRVDSARIAVEKAGERAIGAIGASDAFFPFRDGLDTLAAAGVVAVVEPGGSVRDDEVIAAADEHDITLVFTGERHFRH